MGRSDAVDIGPSQYAVDARPKDTRSSQYYEFSAVTIKKRSIALFLMRLPVFVPIIFIIRPWVELNPHQTLTNTEADVLGSGGIFCLYIALSITPLITLTGAQWIAPLRRWYGIWFAVIGIADTTTAAITTDFAGGVFGRLAGHTFLLTGFFIITLALPVLATANTPAQRKLGRYWKRLQRITYIIWGFAVLHLLLLDGFKPFGAADGDGDPIFHQRFYQAVAISIPLIILRLPPVRRWITEQRAQGRQWLVWLTVSPLVVFYLTAMVFIVNEEIFTGTMAITLRPPAN
jgi:DMSO/TMAO reductase YedYZ heme-binding membrane subunit